MASYGLMYIYIYYNMALYIQDHHFVCPQDRSRLIDALFFYLDSNQAAGQRWSKRIIYHKKYHYHLILIVVSFLNIICAIFAYHHY